MIPHLPDWTGIAGVLAGAAAILGAWLRGRSAKKSNEQQFIDQLQEELADLRARNDDRMTAQDKRMERLEADNADVRRQRDAYRNYAHELRSHIYNELPPPPPPWPEGIPR